MTTTHSRSMEPNVVQPSSRRKAAEPVKPPAPEMAGAPRENGDERKELLRLTELQYDLQRDQAAMAANRDVFLMLLVLFPFVVTILLLAPSFLRVAILRFLLDVFAWTPNALQLFAVLYLPTFLLTLIPFGRLQINLTRLNARIGGTAQKIEEINLLSPSLRVNHLRRQYLLHSERAGRTSWIDSGRRRRSAYLRRKVGDAISESERPQVSADVDQTYDWDDVQLMLTQWDELLKDEERELEGQKRWRVMSISIAIAYLAFLLLAIPVFSKKEDVFGIPFPIVIWSALGSFAAILYRFYKSPERVHFEIEFRWLVARPIIGIVMGTLAYLALLSGLMIFGAGQSATTPAAIQTTGEMAQYWIVAFLAGFSDKFYEKIIELLVGKFGSGKEEEQAPGDPNAAEEQAEAVQPEPLEEEPEAA